MMDTRLIEALGFRGVPDLGLGALVVAQPVLALGVVLQGLLVDVGTGAGDDLDGGLGEY